MGNDDNVISMLGRGKKNENEETFDDKPIEEYFRDVSVYNERRANLTAKKRRADNARVTRDYKLIRKPRGDGGSGGNGPPLPPV